MNSLMQQSNLNNTEISFEYRINALGCHGHRKKAAFALDVKIEKGCIHTDMNTYKKATFALATEKAAFTHTWTEKPALVIIRSVAQFNNHNE